LASSNNSVDRYAPTGVRPGVVPIVTAPNYLRRIPWQKAIQLKGLYAMKIAKNQLLYDIRAYDAGVLERVKAAFQQRHEPLWSRIAIVSAQIHCLNAKQFSEN
jgi:hypothetical protein